MKQFTKYSVVDTTNSYRQGCIPQIIINSDQSDEDCYDDDDEDYPSHGKKKCGFGGFKTSNSDSSVFVNPLRPSEMEDSFSGGGTRKRRNNVWGAVINEQILSQDIKQFGMNASFRGENRDVESYDFRIAKEDDREEVNIKTDSNDKEDLFGNVVDLEREVKKHQNRKRKRNVKERLGDRVVPSLETSPLPSLNVTGSDNVATVALALIDALGEQNVRLFTEIVEAIGSEKSVSLYNKTVDVENAGGLMINNGHRRRTPGGVYIQLLKSDPSIPEPVISGLFEQEQQKWIERNKQIREIKKAARKKWKNKRSTGFDMDYDRPETPTPTKELEDLDNGNEVEVDVADLPDRPDTPEPKDSSDELDEDEDITVVIAKAKAAILKRQKEAAECKTDETVAAADESVEMT